MTTSNFPTEPPVYPFELADPIAPEDLVDELESVFVRRDRDEARIASLLVRAGETEAHERDGYASLTALLKHRMRLHPGEAMRLVRRANALPDMPLTALAYEQGAITGAQVDVLLEVRSVAPDSFTASEGSLVELAMDTPLVSELRRRLDYWLDQVAQEDLASDRNLIRELRSLRLRRDGEMIRVSGWMDLESGERLAARLEPGPRPPRTPGTLPHDGPISFSSSSTTHRRSPGSSSTSPPRPFSKDHLASPRPAVASSSPGRRYAVSPATPT